MRAYARVVILARPALPVSASYAWIEERRLTEEVGDLDTKFDTNPVQQRETRSNVNQLT